MHFKAERTARAWLLDAVFGLESSHSLIVRKGFDGLKSYLAATSVAGPAHIDHCRVR